MIKGVLFDMDGVLVDSEKFICQAAIMMFAEIGLTVKPDDFIPFIGKGENLYLGGVAEKYSCPVDIDKIKARTYAIYETIVSGKLEPLAGVHQFIGRCKERGLRLAVATSADKVKMMVNLREIGLQPTLFDALVNGLDVERKKPFPDIFILAANRMGLNASDCLVVEDAVSGVEAAKAAGARCLALTTSFNMSQLKSADWIAPTLAEAPDEALNW